MSSLSDVTELLTNVDLTPGQAAELRAINSLYYSQLAKDASGSSTSDAARHDLVLGRVRAMLRADQLVILERNLATLESNEARGGRPLRASP